MKVDLSDYFTFGFSLLQFLALVGGLGLAITLIYQII